MPSARRTTPKRKAHKALMKRSLIWCAVLVAVLFLAADTAQAFWWRKKPKTERAKTTSDIFVQGIAYASEGKAMVIIGGKTYREGDEVKGFRIERISPDDVTVSRGGKEHILRVKEKKRLLGF